MAFFISNEATRISGHRVVIRAFRCAQVVAGWLEQARSTGSEVVTARLEGSGCTPRDVLVRVYRIGRDCAAGNASNEVLLVVFQSRVVDLARNVLLYPRLARNKAWNRVNSAVNAVDLHIQADISERSTASNAPKDESVVFRDDILGKFQLYLVGNAVVDVKIVRCKADYGAVVVVVHHLDGNRLVIDAVCARNHRNLVRKVVISVLEDLKTLADLRLHSAFAVQRIYITIAVDRIAALCPLQKLFRVVRSDGDVVSAHRTGHGRLHGDAAVGGNHLGYGNPATSGAAAVDRFLRPEQHSVCIVHFESVSLGLVADNHGTAIVVKYNLLRVTRTQIVGVGLGRVVGGRKVHLEPSGSVVAAILGLKLGL